MSLMSQQPPAKRNANSPNKPGFYKALRRIRRTRTRLLVCFWTLPVYIVAIWVLLNNGRNIDSMMWIYMAVYAGFAIDMSMRHCPVCHHQFYVKSIFLNLLTTKCVHCQQPSSSANFSSKD